MTKTEPGQDDSDGISAPELARRLGYHHTTVWRWISQGLIAAFRVGHDYVVPRDEATYLEEKARGRTAFFITRMLKLRASGLVNIPDAARYIGCSRITLWRWVRDDLVPHIPSLSGLDAITFEVVDELAELFLGHDLLEASALLGIDQSTLRKWTEFGWVVHGRLPNGRVRYPKREIADLKATLDAETASRRNRYLALRAVAEMLEKTHGAR